MLVVPRTPTPPPLEDEAIPTQAGWDELRARYKELRVSPSPNLCQPLLKPSQVQNDGLVKVKREHADDTPTRRQPSRPIDPSEVIELD